MAEKIVEDLKNCEIIPPAEKEAKKFFVIKKHPGECPSCPWYEPGKEREDDCREEEQGMTSGKTLQESSMEDSYLMSTFENLDDEENGLDKTASATHDFLLKSPIKKATEVVEEGLADGKNFLTEERKNKKVKDLACIFYDEKLKMLKAHLFNKEK